MAKFDVEFPEDFLGDLLTTDFDEICEAALTEAAPLLVESMKRAVRSVIDHPGDSELMESIRSNKPQKSKTDAWIVNVNPTGYSENYYVDKRVKGRKTSRKVSNVLKAVWKEYGVNGRQAPRPFLAKATNDVREAAMEKMQAVYNRKVGAK